MDGKRMRRQHNHKRHGDDDTEGEEDEHRDGCRVGHAPRKTAVGFCSPSTTAVFAMATSCVLFAILLLFSAAGRSHAIDHRAAVRRIPGVQFVGHSPLPRNGSVSSAGAEEAPPSRADKLLGGLLADGFDAVTCFSRYQSASYRKGPPYSRLPSQFLRQKLRDQEALQKKCGPGTELFRSALEQLNSGHTTGTTECQYVVWINHSGLGNKMLTIASAFLYAVLNGRALLVDRGADMADLFCEPFPGTTWLLPQDFPLSRFWDVSPDNPRRFGNMLRSNATMAGSSVYLHLDHDYSDDDKLFFCEAEQRPLAKVSWLFLRSNNYFVPSLFLIPAYRDELDALFPEKEAVFHHLGRYLFHPTNRVWGLVTRFHAAYLAKAGKMLGIQIRVFDPTESPDSKVLEQVLSCTLGEKLLPAISSGEPATERSEDSLAVLVASLSSGYWEKIRETYWEKGAANGEVVSVHQATQEGRQQSDKASHNVKAWTEIYLLSLSDALVTSGWSTFGYVAQSLGGIRPWVMFRLTKGIVPDPPCRRMESMEPCFHAPPPYDCEARRGADTGKMVPHVKHCEDVSWGLKLVDPIDH